MHGQPPLTAYGLLASACPWHRCKLSGSRSQSPTSTSSKVAIRFLSLRLRNSLSSHCIARKPEDVTDNPPADASPSFNNVSASSQTTTHHSSTDTHYPAMHPLWYTLDPLRQPTPHLHPPTTPSTSRQPHMHSSSEKERTRNLCPSPELQHVTCISCICCARRSLAEVLSNRGHASTRLCGCCWCQCCID